MSDSKKKTRAQSLVNAILAEYESTGEQTDPMGSYTGMTDNTRAAFASGVAPTRPVPEGKRYCAPESVFQPVQDADDL